MRDPTGMNRITARIRAMSALVVSLIGAWTALVATGWLVAELVRKFLGSWEMNSIDLPLVTYAAGHRNQWLNRTMEAITSVGNDRSLWAVVFLAGILLSWITHSWRPLLILAVALIGALSLERALKFAVARPRPSLALQLVGEESWAFPSGHAIKSGALYIALAYLFSLTQAQQWAKASIWLAAITIALLVGVSRVYLGVHWPTDVAGGWAMGAIWSTIVIATSREDTAKKVER